MADENKMTDAEKAAAEKAAAEKAAAEKAAADAAAEKAAADAAKAKVEKEKADKIAAKTAKAKPAELVYAVHKINGIIEPGMIFAPASDEERAELVELGAIRALTEDEATLFAAKSDPLG